MYLSELYKSRLSLVSDIFQLEQIAKHRSEVY